MNKAMGWFVHCLRHYAQFSGRASRPEYWWFYAVVMAVNFVLIILSLASWAGGLLGVIWSLGVVIPHLAVCSRRLHDTGHSFWWVAPPVGGYLILATSKWGDRIPYGVGPFLWLAWLGFAATLLWFLCEPGDHGPNRYGDSAATGPT